MKGIRKYHYYKECKTMKHILMCALILSSTGCFAAEYDAINENYAAKIRYADAQCKDNMTDWCIMYYKRAEMTRQHLTQDLQMRRESFANSMSHMGDGFKSNNVSCTSNSVGNYTYTNCR